MAISEDNEQLVATLLSSWSSPNPNENLNIQFRNDLRLFAKKAAISYTQDNAGNIYIVRPGLDSSLSNIALALPLDSNLPSGSCEGALRTFFRLLSTTTTTDVALLGLTSPSNSRIGREVWEGTESARDFYHSNPELEAFSANVEPDEIATCALLELEESEQEPLTASGSPLLADQARTATNMKVVVRQGEASNRCAAARLQGKSAVDVAVAVVVSYGDYVKKLFDNFD